MIVKRIILALWRRRTYIYAFPVVRGLIKLTCRRAGSITINSIKFNSFSTFVNRDIIYESLTDEANRYLNNLYYLFGVEKQINDDKWNQDFRTGYIWPSGRSYFMYKIINYSTHSDVKFAWDMSRCHHLLILGEAYQITGDERYSEKIKSEILDFNNNNPFLRSINWTCAMDVGIRAANWLHALALIGDSHVMKNDGFVRTIAYSMSEHAFFIEKNLEKGKPYSGNHYIADLVGLLHIYVFFGRRDKKWAFILGEFQNEIRNQVLPSGFHYEKSTSYHKLVLEMVLFTYLLLQRNNIQLENDVIKKIIDMTHFWNFIIQPDGNIPYIGDNDNGRFLPYTTTSYNDGLELMRIAKLAFPNEKYGKASKNFYCSDANFAVLREKNLYATIHNNPMSRYSDGVVNKLYDTHTHCDMLSFTFSVGKQNIIVDPGTYCYTSFPELRKKYRSTKMHNTISVDGLDQQLQNTRNLFSLTQYSFPVESRMYDGNEYQGEYEFVENGHRQYSHRRLFSLTSSGCKLKDNVKLSGDYSVASYYHLGANVQPTIIGEKILLETSQCQCLMKISSSSKYKVSICEDEIAPSYGAMERAYVIKVEFEKSSQTIIANTEITVDN